ASSGKDNLAQDQEPVIGSEANLSSHRGACSIVKQGLSSLPREMASISGRTARRTCKAVAAGRRFSSIFRYFALATRLLARALQIPPWCKQPTVGGIIDRSYPLCGRTGSGRCNDDGRDGARRRP